VRIVDIVDIDIDIASPRRERRRPSSSVVPNGAVG